MNRSDPEPFLAENLLRFIPQHRRRILCLFPAYSKSFGTFDHAFELMGSVKAFMPPQGILLIAALLPKQWEVRFVDENVGPVTEEDIEWAEAIFLSGMHIQRGRLEALHRQVSGRGKVTVLGGPSVSAAPDSYPQVDILHCGEVGDATLALFQRLDLDCRPPERQWVLKTDERLDMELFPSPAYELLDIRDYLLSSILFSSGCPFLCEFCDIPALYGRRPRQKRPEQIIRELDRVAKGGTPSVYFVDDNFIADPKAANELLDHLIPWQRRWDYSVRLACEATLNLAQHPRILEKMRQAGFAEVYCGIETPEPSALKAMQKQQNLRLPILEAVETINKHGMEVAGGIILGLDTDTDETADAIIEFVRASQIPILTVNLLYALPHTALYDRLTREGRVVDATDRESNVKFLRPYDTVISDWRRIIQEIYEPTFLYERYATQAAGTFIHRVPPRQPLRQLTLPNVKRALTISGQLLRRVGIGSDYRREFWGMVLRELRRGCVENVFQIAMVAHHLIQYSRDCMEGAVQASNYSERRVDASDAVGERVV